MPAGSAVTLEPGGQIELSTPPREGVVASVEALRTDREVLRERQAEAGFGAAGLGTDLARPVQRVNPSRRYLAMEQHFDALGCAGSGKAMMSGTAALQVNLDAGPVSGWDERLRRICAMVPMLVAASSSSPYLGGLSSGWHSMRQGTWQGIDRGRSDPISDGEPTAAWAFYALSAPVMLVQEGDDLVAVTDRVPFAAWLKGAGPVRRRPTVADLEYHLTTLFPPVRPRGYVEIRCLDSLPDRWWPAVAAMTAVLADDPVASDAAAELCEPVAHDWTSAARDGLADAAVHRAALGCAVVAARHCPEPLRREVEAYAELIAAGRTPSGELRARVEEVGPIAVLEEEARA
jgi:glutamate--cysteine ligase